jgi:hypothetical protein
VTMNDMEDLTLKEVLLNAIYDWLRKIDRSRSSITPKYKLFVL